MTDPFAAPEAKGAAAGEAEPRWSVWYGLVLGAFVVQVVVYAWLTWSLRP